MTEPINDPAVDRLIALIDESFRVRPNHDPIYVDVGSHLQTLALLQHQVVFGRRGSGKSCLLVHYHRVAAEQFETLSIYVDVDEFKTLRYPDLLIRLLLEVFEKIGGQRGRIARFFRRSETPVESQIRDLRELLSRADTAEVQEQATWTDTTSAGGGINAPLGIVLGAEASTSEGYGRTSRFVSEKLDFLVRNLRDYKSALEWALARSEFRTAALLLDDFYLLPRNVQPDVVDYLHRLLRGTDLYLKLATIRHRTSLLKTVPQSIGVELYQDVQEINLDRTLEELEATESYLMDMLTRMAGQVGLNSVDGLFNPDAKHALTLASGGVPRDYLTMFSEALQEAMRTGRPRLTPTGIYRAASSIAYRTKLSNLRSDTGRDSDALERVFQDLLVFCLREKKKTAFLIAQDDRQTFPNEYALIQQVMDFKLIHVIEPDTSAASGRSGRFEAYTLDFALFMEPRRRGIELVEFWKIDAGRRRQGVREAPDYPLARAAGITLPETTPALTTEEVIADLEAEGVI